MAYKQIMNAHRGSGKALSVRGQRLIYMRDLQLTGALRCYVGLYENDEGFLCFKFSEEKEKGFFTVSAGSNAFTSRIPVTLEGRIKDGYYDAEEKDGYFVTNCKIEKQKIK